MNHLSQIPESLPKWVELKAQHRIQSIPPASESDQWTANSQAHYAYKVGDTEREAVVSLIHELKLEGWDTVSINP